MGVALRRLASRNLSHRRRPVTGFRLPNLIAALTLLATLGGLAFGLPAVDRSLPAERPVQADRRYPVGAGVSIVPPAGAVVDLTRTRPGARRGALVFRLGGVRCAVTVQPSRGTAGAAVERLRRRLAGLGNRITGPEQPVFTDSGLPGLQGSWTAAPDRTGRYAVYLAGGLVVEVTINGTGNAPDLAVVEASLRTIAHRAAR
jgi:hypothetical protein